MKTLKFLSLFLIITLFGCTEENNYYTTADGLGKVNIYIEGNITNEQAQAKLQAEIGTQTENIYVQNTTQLTDITISFSKDIRDIYFSNIPTLKNITIQGSNNKINKLEIENNHYLNKILIEGIVEANKLDFGHMAGDYNLSEFIDIECHDLITVQGDLRLFIGQYDHPAFNKLNFYDLKYVNKTIRNSSSACRWQGNYSEFNMPQLEEVYALEHFVHALNINYPKLKKIGGIGIDYGPEGQNINIPLVEEISGGLGLDVNNGIINFPLLKKVYSLGTESTNSTINLPLLERADNFYIYDKSSTLVMPNFNYCLVYENQQNLTSAEVNAILNQFLSVQPVSGKFIYTYGALPSGQGIIDKQTLINQGNTVITSY